jgi:sporulation protein YlmC with PRC-barrel domain
MRIPRNFLYFLALIGLGVLTTGGALAQERAKQPSNQPGDAARIELAKNVRASQLIGLQVRNKEGKHIGKIEDMVVDLKQGDVRYAALSFGGFAGFGTKLFAIPWQAMTYMLAENDRHFVLDVTPEKLQQQEGFDSSHWPNFADKNWTASVDRHYNVERRQEPEATGKAEDKGGATVAFDTAFRVSKIKDLKVLNDRNQDLGRIDDLVIDMNAGKVKYAALAHGTTLGLGGKLFAVPLSEFTLKHAANDAFLVLNVDQESLKNAPGFDKDHWPNVADSNWAAEVDRYYERTAKRPTTVK